MCSLTLQTKQEHLTSSPLLRFVPKKICLLHQLHFYGNPTFPAKLKKKRDSHQSFGQYINLSSINRPKLKYRNFLHYWLLTNMAGLKLFSTVFTRSMTAQEHHVLFPFDTYTTQNGLFQLSYLSFQLLVFGSQ